MCQGSNSVYFNLSITTQFRQTKILFHYKVFGSIETQRQFRAINGVLKLDPKTLKSPLLVWVPEIILIHIKLIL